MSVFTTLPGIILLVLFSSCARATYTTTTEPAPVIDLYDTLTTGVEILGADINLPGDNYGPSISPDGLILYYTHNPVDSRSSDILAAKKSVPESFEFLQGATPFRELNTALADGTLAFSEDGKTKVYVTCNQATGLGDCDLYELTNLEWERSKAVNISTVNSAWWDSAPALSSDGSALLFASNRPDNGRRLIPQQGYVETDSDIFLSRRGADGEWGAAGRLGEPINSPSNEDSPFLAHGDLALFFASDRPGGYGGYDLYVSFGSEGGWGEPKNLGPLFNTSANERYLTMTRDGRVVYFSSDRDGDRYRIYMLVEGARGSD